MNVSESHVVDFHLHDIVKIRFVNPSTADKQIAVKQLGLFQKAFEGEPDILVKFVSGIHLQSPIRYVELENYGYSDNHFLISSKQKGQLFLASVPIGDIGRERVVITCEAGIGQVPLLAEAIHLKAIEKNILPLHASSFKYAQLGVLTTGWPKGGKTSLMLAFAAQGGQLISDDWLYVRPDQQMLGIPTEITLRDWQLDQMPSLQEKITRAEYLRLKSIQAVRSVEQSLPETSFPGAAQVRRGLGRLSKILERKAHTKLEFGDLIKSDIRTSIPIDYILIGVSHQSSEIGVVPLETDQAVEKILEIQRHEWQPLMNYYAAYRFGFDGQRNEVLDQLDRSLHNLIRSYLQNSQTYIVYHPHPVKLIDLFHAIQPILNNT